MPYAVGERGIRRALEILGCDDYGLSKLRLHNMKGIVTWGN